MGYVLEALDVIEVRALRHALEAPSVPEIPPQILGQHYREIGLSMCSSHAETIGSKGLYIGDSGRATISWTWLDASRRLRYDLMDVISWMPSRSISSAEEGP